MTVREPRSQQGSCLFFAAAFALTACGGSAGGGPNGSCQDACDQGDSQCVSGSLATCVAQSNGCLAYGTPVACPGGFVCSGGVCAVSCTDQCAAGNTRCTGAEIETCAIQASGCTDWNAPVACGNNQSCSGSTCASTSCTDACTAGQTSCASPTSETVCQMGASGCLELVTTNCPSGDSCANNICAPTPVCSNCPNGYSCGTGNVCVGGDSGDLVLNVRTVGVSGKVTLNGALPVSTGCEYQGVAAADVNFYETTHGYQFSAPIVCTTTDFTFAQTVFPGTYRVSIDNGYQGSGSNLPDANYVVADALVIGADLNNQVFDVKTVSIAGSVTLNGALPVSTGCEYQGVAAADVNFYETTHGYQFSAAIPCTSTDFTFSKTIFPGTYKVSIDNGYQGTGANLPDANYVVANALAVSSSLSNQTFNVQTVTIAGKVTLNSLLPVSTGCEYQGVAAADVNFYETTHGYQFSAAIPCTTTDFTFSKTIFPGTYRVSIDNGYQGTGANLPDANYVASNALLVSSNLGNQVFNVETLTIAGNVTLNGALPVSTGCEYQGVAAADVNFYETTHGYQFSAAIPCTSTDFTFSKTIFPGTYKVSIDNGYQGTGANLPDANYVANNSLVVTSNLSNQSFNVQTLTIAGSVTLNGALPVSTGCEYQGVAAADVNFYETTHGYQFSAAIPSTSTAFTFSKTIFPGTYKVSIDNGYQGTGANLPGANYVASDALSVSSNLSNQVFDVRTASVGGSMLLNGAVPVSTGCEYQGVAAADVNFYELTHGYQFSAAIPCTSTDFTFSKTIFPGTYQITVDNGYQGSGANLPDANYVAVDSIQLP